MKTNNFEIESATPFAGSLLWKINRDFYEERGISAWSDDIVPHHLTSNSKVGETYAELIFAFLRDLGTKGKHSEVVYIVELGAGHGRLAFHVLKHLEKLVDSFDTEIPPFCYVVSDIIEENLLFFHSHPQFQNYFERGMLDLAYFDAFSSKKIYLRNAKKTINPNDLNQAILTIANYFFDSIPTELFYIENKVISSCSIAINSKENPNGMRAEDLLKSMEFSYSKSVPDSPVYTNPLFNEILEDYRDLFSNTYLFFPKKGMECLENLKAFSRVGLVLLSIDKGFHEIGHLKNKKEPEIITHGSFSIWVNFHALSNYCTKQGGKVFFPSLSNFHLEIACLLFLEDGESYTQTNIAYEKFVNNFGPDDYTTIMKLAYSNVSQLKLVDLIALFRLSSYDSTFFVRILPRLKQLAKRITIDERKRLAETMDRVWNMYFSINEGFDLAYEIGGLLYDLGYYAKALNYFQYSVKLFGLKADIYYNQALCYYQLNEDRLFYKTLNEGKKIFPDYQLFKELDNLDMG